MNRMGRERLGAAGLEREAMAWPRAGWEEAAAEEQAVGGSGGGRPPAGAGHGGGLGRGSALRDVVETIVLTLLIAAGIQLAVQSRQIEGSSMEPTLHNGQRLLINRLAYLDPNEAQRGDIIVFRAWDQDEDFIKRVIGVPGDEIEIRDSHILVNGQALDEPYIANEPTFGTPDTVILGPGEYYVLGDNRGNSSDSRLHGPLPAGNIIGKAWLTYWPLGDLSFISDSTSYAAPK